MEPQNMLRRLVVGLEAGQIPQDVARWLLDGIAEFGASGGTLCGRLGLRAPGQRSLRTLRDLEIRDRWLARAHAAIGQDGDSDWRRAELLAERIAVRGAHSTRSQPQGVERMLGFAAEHGPLPTSTKQIRAIVRAELRK